MSKEDWKKLLDYMAIGVLIAVGLFGLYASLV